jgi:folate-binding protein YgfZ
MNLDWQTFLERQHALIQEGVSMNFGDAQDELLATQKGMVLCDLSQFGILKISGEESQSFLQNMVSSDVREVSLQQAQISSLSTPKGRMLATFLIWQRDSDYYLQLPRDLLAAVHKRLSMYILRSKVKIEEASDTVIGLGLSGEGATSLLQQHFGSVPSKSFATEQHDNANVIQVGPERYQINTTSLHAPALWQNLVSHARPVGSSCWDWLTIRSGIPVILAATQEQFVPQMANLELIGGVNFKKGCYPGQEIVARMQYLGKSKRRMYLAHVIGSTQAGEQLFSAEVDGHICGMVCNAAPAPVGGYDLLAVMQINSHDTQSVHIGSLQGEALQFLPLPYEIPA